MKSEHRLGKGLGICCATPASEHPRVPWVLRSQWQHWPTPILSIKRYCLSCFPQLQHWYYWKYFLMFRCNYSLHSKCGWGILNFVETVFIINMKCTTSHVKSLRFHWNTLKFFPLCLHRVIEYNLIFIPQQLLTEALKTALLLDIVKEERTKIKTDL